MRKKKKPVREPKDRFCYFCANNIKDIDYKKADMIQKFTSNYAKILPAKRMGTCAKHQRKLATAIKRARYMALLPFTNR
ncbi:MAG: 30S ribosomal protein S18 [Patescibacteria group bacterium]